MLQTHWTVPVGVPVMPDGLLSSSPPSQCVAHAAAHQPFNVGDGPHVVQLSSPVDERGQSRGVQGRLGVLSAVGPAAAHPRVLQTGRSARPLPGVLLQHGRHKVPSSLAHIAEVLVWEAEVQSADVDTRLLRGFVQEGGDAAEHHVGQHAHAPHVRGYWDRRPSDELGRSELWVSQQEVDVAAVSRQLDCVAQVDELNAQSGRVEVHHDVLRLPREEQSSGGQLIKPELRTKAHPHLPSGLGEPLCRYEGAARPRGSLWWRMPPSPPSARCGPQDNRADDRPPAWDTHRE